MACYKYNGKIFNGREALEEYIRSLEQLQFLSTPSGEVYGFVTPEGEMFLDPDIAGVNTLIHEGAHIQYKVLKTAAERGDIKAQAILNKIQELTAPAIETIFNAKKAQERSSDSMSSVDMQAEQIITKKMPELTELADKNIQLLKDYNRYQRILQKRAERRRILKTDEKFLEENSYLEKEPIINLGTPSDILLSVGVTRPIEMTFSNLKSHIVGKEAHEITTLDLVNIMRGIHNPALVNKARDGKIQILTNQTNENGAPIVVILNNNYETRGGKKVANITTAYALTNSSKVVPTTAEDVLYVNKKRLANFLSDFNESKNRGFGITLFAYPEYDSSTDSILYTQERVNPEIEFDTTNIRKIIENTKNIINKTNVNQVDFQIIGEQGAQRVQEYADSLSKAKELEQEGIPYDQIETQTGWYKYEGQWRTIPSEVLQNFKIQNYDKNTRLQLSEVLGTENVLFDLYPELKEITVVFVEENQPNTPQDLPQGFENSAGVFVEATQSIFIPTMVQGGVETSSRTDEETSRLLAHEVNHVIQSLEGFPKGGDEYSVIFEAGDIIGVDFSNKSFRFIIDSIDSTDTSKLTDNERRILTAAKQSTRSFMGGVRDTTFRNYQHILGEIDSRIVEKALELHQQGQTIVNYSEALQLVEIQDNLDLNNIFLLRNRGVRFSLVEPQLTFEAAELSSPAYNQKENETDAQYKERLQEEVFARALGDNGEQYLKDLGFTAQEAKTFLQKVQEFLAEIVDWLRGKKGLQDLSVDEINQLSIREFLDRSTTSMMLGEFKDSPQTAVQEAIQRNEAQEYFTREADRLPLTLAVFNTKPFQDLQGKQVKPATIQQLLNKSGIKQIEKDLINRVLSDNYSGQKRIDYDEFEATVRANIMPLERLTTSSYADYGMDNLGDGNYGEAKTLILNSPIEHGVTGHFSGDFKASGRQNIKYVPKQLNDNTWVAVEEGYESQANNNNIYQFVGTAGTKEAVDDWIENYNSSKTEQKFDKDFLESKGVMFSKYNKQSFIDKYGEEEWDFSEYSDNDIIFEAIVPEAIEEQFDATNVRQRNTSFESVAQILGYTETNEYKATPDINKGMFGHIRVWEDGQFFYVAELQSDYFQKNNARKDLVTGSDDYLKGVRDIKNNLTDELNERQEAGEISYQEANEIYRKEVSKRLVKFEESFYKNLSPQEKQFIASQKVWEQRMVREAIKEASLSGAASLRFPTPYTLSVIEGYISGNEATETAPYQILEGNSNSLKEGDVVNYLNKEYIIVEANENTIKIVEKAQDDITQEIIDDIVAAKGSEQFIKENKINDDKYIYKGFYLGDKGVLYVEKVKKPDDYETNDKYFEEGLFESQNLTKFSYYEKHRKEIEDVVGKMTDEEFLEFIEDSEIQQQEKVNLSLENASKDFNGQFELPEYSPTIDEIKENVLDYTSSYKVIDNRVYSTESVETLKQPDKYISQKSEGFDISTMLSEEEQTVARKYEEIAEILRKERGDNFEVVTDENGFDWYETKITPEESQNPVVAFQINATEQLLTTDIHGTQEYVPANSIITYYTEIGEINYKQNPDGSITQLKTVSVTPQQEESIAYQQLLSIPNLSKEQALEAYKNLYSTKFYDWNNKTNEC